MMNDNIERLCYIYKGKAYFTYHDITEVCGDDWDDIPYEYNAEPPYSRYISSTLYFEVDMYEPYERFVNSPYSVEMINAGQVPWLVSISNDNKIIPAGISKEYFVEAIRKWGGKLWVESTEQSII